MSNTTALKPDIERLRDNVLITTKAVMDSHADLPQFETAKLMLMLMSGETNVLEKMPTITNPQKLNTTVAASESQELGAETSPTSIIESKGLLGLTKDNVVDILTYVNKSLAFPLNESDAEKKLGYKKTEEFCKNHPEFSPKEFVKFYEPFNNHAKLWADIESGENGIIAQGNNIKTYGTSFVSHADFVINFISKMDVFPSEIGDVPLTDKDKKTKTSLGKILELWQKETLKHHESTSNLLVRLVSFQNTLVNTLQPSGNNKLEQLSTIDIAAETKKLKQDMDLLKKEIEILQKEYDISTGLAFTGAAGMIFPPLGILTWAVTGGVFGAKAEKARKERNKKQAVYADKIKMYNSLNSVSSSVHDATASIADLNLAVTNAITGLNTLNAVWNIITKYITSAKNSLMEIDGRSDLITFYYEIQSARDSWAEVPSLAGGLLDLFNQARRETILNIVFTEKINSIQEYMFPNVLSYADEPMNTTIPFMLTGSFSDTFDIKIWHDKYAELNNVLIKPDSTYMPTLQKKAANLKEYSRCVYNEVTNTLASVGSVDAAEAKSALDYKLYEVNLKKLEENPNDETAKKWVNAITERFKLKTNEFDSKLKILVKDIKSNTKVLIDNTRQDLTTTGFFAQLNSECKRFDNYITKHTELMKNNFLDHMIILEEEMKTLDADIKKKTDPENVLSSFKAFFPTESEVSGMIKEGSKSQEAAEIEAIKLIYSTSLKAFDAFTSVVKLCSDINKFKELSNALSELRVKYYESYEQLQHMLGDQNELNNLTHLFKTLEFFGKFGNDVAEYVEGVRLKLSNKASDIDIRGYHEAITDFINEIGAIE